MTISSEVIRYFDLKLDCSVLNGMLNQAVECKKKIESSIEWLRRNAEKSEEVDFALDQAFRVHREVKDFVSNLKLAHAEYTTQFKRLPVPPEDEVEPVVESVRGSESPQDAWCYTVADLLHSRGYVPHTQDTVGVARLLKQVAP